MSLNFVLGAQRFSFFMAETSKTVLDLEATVIDRPRSLFTNYKEEKKKGEHKRAMLSSIARSLESVILQLMSQLSPFLAV